MNETTNLIVGGLVGALIKYIFDEFKSRADFKNQAFNGLFNDRWNYYQKLWSLSGVLPKWPRNEQIAIQDLYDLSSRLKDWYFDKGGILLSEDARQKYGDVQKTLTSIYNSVDNKQNKVDSQDYDTIVALFSDLRGEITQDLMSRKRQLLL